MAEPLLFPARMSHGRGKSMSRSAALVTAGLAALAALVIASPASAAPAVDEYGADLPTAGGHKSQGSSPPQSHPEQLPPAVAKKLRSSDKGKELAALATAGELGAPPADAAAGNGVAGNEPGDDSE